MENPGGSDDKPWMRPILLYLKDQEVGPGKTLAFPSISELFPLLPPDLWGHSPKEVRKLMQGHIAIRRWGPLEASLPEPSLST